MDGGAAQAVCFLDGGNRHAGVFLRDGIERIARLYLIEHKFAGAVDLVTRTGCIFCGNAGSIRFFPGSGKRNTAGDTWKLVFNKPISSISRQSIKLSKRWLGRCKESQIVPKGISEPVSSEFIYSTTKSTICKSFNGKKVDSSRKAPAHVGKIPP